jgi:Ulp1 family protease
MAKKAPAKAVEVKEEVKAVEAVVETAVKEAPVVEAAPVEEAPKKRATKSASKKKAEKKPAAKKTAEKKTAEKKTAEKTSSRKAAPKTNLFIQYQGVELSYADLIERVKADSGIDSPKSVNLYVKPEDNMVYYVVNENEKVGGFVIA